MRRNAVVGFRDRSCLHLALPGGKPRSLVRECLNRVGKSKHSLTCYIAPRCRHCSSIPARARCEEVDVDVEEKKKGSRFKLSNLHFRRSGESTALGIIVLSFCPQQTPQDAHLVYLHQKSLCYNEIKKDKVGRPEIHTDVLSNRPLSFLRCWIRTRAPTATSPSSYNSQSPSPLPLL